MSDDPAQKIGLPEIEIEITAPKYKGPGRPSKYDPAFCAEVVECGTKGMSRTQIAGWLNVRRATLANWEAEFPEFLAAMQHAQELAMNWFETAGQRGMFMKGFQPATWSLQMRNRFPEHYRDEKTLNVRSHEEALDALK